MSAAVSPDVLVAAARGDDDALAALVRAYHARVHRVGLRACRDRFDVDDAVQEAFAKLSRRPDVQRDQGVLAWLFTVVRNACLRLMRPLQRERRHLGERALDLEDDAPADTLDPQAAIERWELVHAVHAAIASLDRPYREVLILRDLEGMSGDDTCAALELPVATMKTRLHRARIALRAELRRRGIGPQGDA